MNVESLQHHMYLKLKIFIDMELSNLCDSVNISTSNFKENLDCYFFVKSGDLKNIIFH